MTAGADSAGPGGADAGAHSAGPGDDDRRRLRHDLRTPLTIVAGFAEVLAADRAISEEDRRDYARRIQDAAAEIRRLVDVLLDEPPLSGGGSQAA